MRRKKLAGSGKLVPKWYQREGQPRKTENEPTNDRSKQFKPNPNTKPKPKKETKEKKLEEGKIN